MADMSRNASTISRRDAARQRAARPQRQLIESAARAHFRFILDTAISSANNDIIFFTSPHY